MIASVSSSSKIVVEKSTVPVKTAEAIEKVRALLAGLQRHHLYLQERRSLCSVAFPAMQLSFSFILKG